MEVSSDSEEDSCCAKGAVVEEKEAVNLRYAMQQWITSLADHGKLLLLYNGRTDVQSCEAAVSSFNRSERKELWRIVAEMRAKGSFIAPCPDKTLGSML